MEEAKVQYLIDLGNTILACVQRQGEAERYIDTKLSEVEERWFNLVTQVCMWEGGGVWGWGVCGRREGVDGEMGVGEIHMYMRAVLIQIVVYTILCIFPRSPLALPSLSPG